MRDTMSILLQSSEHQGLGPMMYNRLVYRQQTPKAQTGSSAKQATATKNAGTQRHVNTGPGTKALLPAAEPRPKPINGWLTKSITCQ